MNISVTNAQNVTSPPLGDGGIISLIVAASTNNAIGKSNQLLWHLPIDLKFFKNTTWALPVIMGRKTFESVGSKPLTGRTNIIISRKTDLKSIYENVWFAISLENALEQSKRLVIINQENKFAKMKFILPENLMPLN